MSTTKLFVELVVIGAGAFGWFILLALAVFGYDRTLLDALKSPVIVIACLPLIYVLGIITDRFADATFQRLVKISLKDAEQLSRNDQEKARRLVFDRSERVAELVEYGRHRLRICRGWAFNSVLSAVMLNILLLRIPDLPVNRITVGIYGTCVALLFAVSGWWSWKRILTNEYRVLKEELTRS